MVRVVQSLCDRKLPTVLGDMVMHCYLHHCQLIFYHTMTPIVSIAHVEENEDSDNDHETVESNDRDSDSVNDQKIMIFCGDEFQFHLGKHQFHPSDLFVKAETLLISS